MLTYLTAHAPQIGKGHVMSQECRDWLRNSKTEKLFIFIPDARDYTQFVEETKLCVSKTCQITTLVFVTKKG